jgi:hypothetical protein
MKDDRMLVIIILFANRCLDIVTIINIVAAHYALHVVIDDVDVSRHDAVQ